MEERFMHGQLPSRSGPFFGVYDRRGRCVAVGLSSDEVVEVARDRLNFTSRWDVLDWYKLVRISRAECERQRRAGL
jgi:hypothetical protein